MCSAGPTDDVIATTHVVDGDMLITAAHELGHTINNCACTVGAGCARMFALSIPRPSRPMNPADWKFAVSDAENEVVPTFIGNVLTRFLYNNTLVGVPFDHDWHYISYTSTTDSFGSLGQGGPLGDCLAGTTCPSGYTCVASSHSWWSDPATVPPYRAGTCVPNPSTCNGPTGTCPPGLECTNVVDSAVLPGGQYVCYHSQYRNKFWDSLGDRLVYMLGWREALSLTLTAVGGQAANGTRDIVDGTDNYYARYRLNKRARYEVMRGFQAVYRGTTPIVLDDFTDQGVHAAPISIRTGNWLDIWWGHGSGSYPYFADSADADVVLFRGLKGASYDFEAWLMDTSGAPVMTVTRLNDPSSTSSSAWTSTSGSLTTPALPATDWYAVEFWSSGPGRWRARARVASGADDLAGSVEEALPVVHGVAVTGTLTSTSDEDTFQIHAPTASTSLTITATGPSSVWATVYAPGGSIYTWALLTTSSPSLTISSLPSAGHWTWALSGATGSYSTSASLGCGGSTPGCDTSPGVRTARYAWGDRFAGRLPDGTTEHVYRIALQEYQGVSVSLADNADNCEAEVRVFAPSEQRHIGTQPVLRWTDGAATTDLAGNRAGIGGFFEALTTGTYEVRVRSPGAACSYYRLQLATTNVRGPSMPAW